jgi:hypothetical protein
MVHRAVIVADWIRRPEYGYIAVSALSDAERVWSSESEEILSGFGRKAALAPWIRMALDAWNIDHPLEGGAWGQNS